MVETNLNKRKEISESLLKVSCPNCGAQMNFKDNYMFKCDHCNTILYVYPKDNVNLLACDMVRDSWLYPHLSKEQVIEFDNNMKREMAFKIGEYLLENDYLYFENRTDYLTNNDILSCAVKVIRKDKDEYIKKI